MDKENGIISKFANKYIGDDGVVLDGIVYSKDIFAQNSHFKLGWLTPFEIGRKAMMVNVSDAVVMNAKAKFALLGLSVPKSFSLKMVSEIRDGIMDVCKQYDIEIIGGDTICSEILSISVTLISYTKDPIYRGKLKNGDLLAFTGNLGGSLKALRMLKNGGKVGVNSRFKKVILRDKFFYKSAKFMRSAMDISDGLRSDLPKFTKKKDIKFSKRLSIFEFCSGEEYEVLFACDPKHKTRLINEAKKARIKLTFFAKTIRGKQKKYGKNEHF